jgi:thiol:disulfide interchange protein DsbD
LTIALCAFLASLILPVSAEGPSVHLRGDDVVRARLVLSDATLAPGTSTPVTVELTPAAGWHLYGPEHGDAGAPPEISWTLPPGARAGAIAFPPSRRVQTHGLTTYEYDGPTALRIPLAIAATVTPSSRLPIRADVSWLVCSNVCAPGRASLATTVTIAAVGANGYAAFAAFVGFAFLGGLVLNLMPCVFPVLSFKALRAIGEPYDRRVRSAIAYTAGVVLSCASLGVALIVARSAGAMIGWGFQLQSPVFVGALAALLLAMGLAMSGVVEMVVPIPPALARRAATAGAFGDGILVTLIASACVAPYMGAALAFALSASAPVAIGVFVALGLGLALPQALVMVTPALLRWVPKPGAWLLVARRVLSIPLYLSAAWLAWVLVLQIAPPQPAPLAQVGQHDATFGPASLERLRREHHAVLVDIGAAWCITCKVNERLALDRPEVARRLRDLKVTVLYGDWTRQDPQITAYLHGLGTAGVPLYVYYSRDGGTDVWPQILTPKLVLDRLM